MKINKLIYIFFFYFIFLNNVYSIEPNIFVQSTVDRASKLLSNNISKKQKIDELQIDEVQIFTTLDDDAM